MPRVGIISDTHGTLPEGVFEAFANVDYIIHAGDICARGVLWELESIATTFAVLGNCDYLDYGAAVRHELSTSIGGVRVYVSHFPEDAQRAAASGDYGLAVHGHTHVPRDEQLGSCRIVNPGSACRPRNGSERGVALVRLENGVVGPVRRVLL